MELLRRGAEHSIQDKVCVCDLRTGTTSTSEAVLEIRKTRQVSVALDNHAQPCNNLFFKCVSQLRT